MSLKFKTLLAIYFFSTICKSDGIILTYGQSTSIDESKATEIGYVFEIDKPFNLSQSIPLSLEIELSYSDWQNLYGPDITGGAILPMWSYKYPWKKLDLFVNAGIGVAYISGTQWGNRTLGDNWIFKDKLALGLNINDQHALSFSLTHYSNAGFNKNNDGTNIISLNYNLYW